MSKDLWSVPRAWVGESCFIVCGGPSVSDLDLSKLAGRRVIVVNSSCFTCPDADFLVFADKRWWLHNEARIAREFRGQPVAITPMLPSNRYHLLERQRSSGLALHPQRLALWHTTVTAATNLAVNLGVAEINYLGLDGADRGDRMWHHEPHPWKPNPNRYDHHRVAMEKVAADLSKIAVRAHNANPEAAFKMFPHRPFEEMLS